MKPSNCLTLLCIGLILSVMGCITSLQTRSLPADVATAASGVTLSLKAPTSTYTSKAPIPLELSIQGGEFNLFVPLKILLANSRKIIYNFNQRNAYTLKFT